MDNRQSYKLQHRIKQNAPDKAHEDMLVSLQRFCQFNDPKRIQSMPNQLKKIFCETLGKDVRDFKLITSQEKNYITKKWLDSVAISNDARLLYNNAASQKYLLELKTRGYQVSDTILNPNYINGQIQQAQVGASNDNNYLAENLERSSKFNTSKTEEIVTGLIILANQDTNKSLRMEQCELLEPLLKEVVPNFRNRLDIFSPAAVLRDLNIRMEPWLKKNSNASDINISEVRDEWSQVKKQHKNILIGREKTY